MYELDDLTTIDTYDFISHCIALFVMVIFFIIIKRKDVLQFKATAPKFYVLAMLLGIGFVFFQALLNILYHLEIDPEFYTYEFTLKRLKLMFGLSIIIIAPITEELFFRGYLQRELTKKYKPYLAIFLASLLFAFIHLQIQSSIFNSSYIDWHHAYIAFFGGFISGVLFYKSKSITPSILYHIFWNLTVTVV